ncbi:MAG: substrate-binding domain-containing protein, partial [Paracoccaceae bacterium]
NRDVAAQAARRMFDRPDRPDAVFVCNDHMAFAVIDVLRDELGLMVPMDVSVVGYDDVPAASYGGYKLTTVRQRANAMVDETVEILLEQIETPEAPKRGVAIDAPLIVRHSARIPKGWTT